MTTAYLTLIGPPAIALVVSGWLRDAKLPRWADTLIALLVVLGTAWIWALVAGKLVGDLAVDTLVIAGYVAALLAGPMYSLHEWLVDVIPSPLSAIAEALCHYAPTPIDEETLPLPCRPTLPKLTLPTTPDLVARSSLLSNDPLWKATVAGPITNGIALTNVTVPPPPAQGDQGVPPSAP